MARWEPNAGGRLQEAALELYAKQGYENTTVAEIAALAGVTERTFFRHFADKREVLFGGSALLSETLVAVVGEQAPDVGPMDAVGVALESLSPLFEEIGDRARRRHAVIEANVELQERELIKLASLASALAGALRARGVAEPAATLTAEAGMAVFRVAFERWVTQTSRRRTLAHHVRTALTQLRAVASS